MEHEPIHEKIAAVARRHPELPAIEWEDQRVSYRQLIDRANQLGRQLLDAGLEPRDPVAILATMTADVVAAMLAVLKAGGAFVPFDLELPSARLEVAAAEIHPRWWLVDASGADDLRQRLAAAGTEAKVLPLNPGWLRGEPEAGSSEPLAVERDPDDFCYVYFTSGSTGRPKAIGGRLQAIDHFVRWHIETFGVDTTTRVAQVTSFAFDGFLHEAFCPLAAGGTLCVSSSRETLLDGVKLRDWLDEKRITLIHCTPTLFRSVLQQDLEPGHLSALQWVLLAGEVVQPSDVKRLYEVFGERIRLANLYGPTETTLTKFCYVVPFSDADAKSISIGQPMPGCRALIVDEQMRPCPPGRLGEILLRTPYRSLGYINLPEKTAETFIQNPFSDKEGDIVYRTGDLGRLREDGLYDFLGRRDQQVKVRGVRVELGAIEGVLREVPGVEDVAVIDRTDPNGNKYLCAYLVLTGQHDPEEMRAAITARLPETMVPAAYVAMKELPRTLNGKIDRRSLPEPQEAGGRLRSQYIAPRTPVEEKLCQFFTDLLRIEKVGVRDNFFELGGHSLLVMQLLARIRSGLAEVPLGQVFETPTVEGLALAVTRLQMKQVGAEEMAGLLAEIENLGETEAGEAAKP